MRLESIKYIQEFKEDDHVLDHYLCKQKQSLKSRTGKTYLSLKLQDKTGMIDAKVWEISSDIQNFDEGDYIKVDGIVLMYQNELQLKISRIRKSEPDEIDLLNYIPCTEKDIEEMYTEIELYIESINNKFVRTLMENIIVKNTSIASAFKTHSAAKQIHHSYMGGLLEHTLSVTQICDFLSSHYKSVNRDILIATAILHDIGKIYELAPMPQNDYTDDGQLLGHIYIGAQLIHDEAALIENFPHELASMLIHCILSHHGEYEFGSPKRPKTIEAFILHFADNADAKIKVMEETIDNTTTLGNWSGYHRMLQRNIRKSNF